ncbi:MAG TPA: hypothetical protein VG755_03710 [Nannocystaceae bacterium]|nr:hypothetical protein [Nannocystaceae bacterium]
MPTRCGSRASTTAARRSSDNASTHPGIKDSMQHCNTRLALLLLALPACDITEREIGESRERWSVLVDDTDATALAELADGDLVVVAEQWTGAGAQPYSSPSRGLVTRHDANAEIVWQRAEVHATLPNLRFDDVAVGPDGTVVAVGHATDERNDYDPQLIRVVRAFSAAGEPMWAIEAPDLPDDLIAARDDGTFLLAGNVGELVVLGGDGSIGATVSLAAAGDDSTEWRGLVPRADGSAIGHLTHYGALGVSEEVLALDATLSRTASTMLAETGNQRSTSDGGAGMLLVSVHKSTPDDPHHHDTEVLAVVPGADATTIYTELDSQFAYHSAALKPGGVLALVGRLTDRSDADDSAAVIREIDLESGESLWKITRRGGNATHGQDAGYVERVLALASGDLAVVGSLSYSTGWFGVFAGD